MLSSTSAYSPARLHWFYCILGVNDSIDLVVSTSCSNSPLRLVMCVDRCSCNDGGDAIITGRLFHVCAYVMADGFFCSRIHLLLSSYLGKDVHRGKFWFACLANKSALALRWRLRDSWRRRRRLKALLWQPGRINEDLVCCLLSWFHASFGWLRCCRSIFPSKFTPLSSCLRC